MKKSASSAGAIRMSPSAPTPRWRSQSARMTAGSRRRTSSRSSTITKSFPVPWYLANHTLTLRSPFGPDRPGRGPRFEIPREDVNDLRGSTLPRLEPPDPGVSPKPGQLAPGEGPVSPDDRGDGLPLGHLSAEE